jgi:NAD(P)-dependent dehydrogenase (short-subunit alcohol dehydrogenase family)
MPSSPPRRSGPKTVLVTGASSGIGRATARRFAERGDAVVLVARERSSLEETAAEVRAAGAADTVVSPADVTDEDAVRAVVDAAVARFGRLDVVVHSAQVMAYGRVEDVPATVFDRVVDTALHGTANVARAVLPVFRRQQAGSLVVVSSLLASVATPHTSPPSGARPGWCGFCSRRPGTCRGSRCPPSAAAA